MTHIVNCIKLEKEAQGLKRVPYPGDLGQRIYDNVSQEAWQLWLAHQTMLINENRLTPIEPEARKFLEGEMDKFFFGEGSETPEGYIPENNSE
ncbi:MAG: oxidative damage protection protein [Gammaproteobacteria bacterium]